MSKQSNSCSNCILTDSDTAVISFDDNGKCNYCNHYYTSVKNLGDNITKKKWLDNKITEMVKNKGSHGYDCILGVSGGVDSTYLAYWTKQKKLNPLVVHFDNGWNSELAVKNIENICTILNYQLHTQVINWQEFKELQLAYLKAGVIDIEALTDHAIYATLVQLAKKHKIKYILSGYNLATEAIMPKDWVFDKGDWENIKDIYSKFGNGALIKTFPHITFFQKLYNHWFLTLETVQVLNYIDYNKQEAKNLITKELNWIDYGGKHYESVFTKFYQSYILPKKFNVDKRKAHLATLICSQQISKTEAIAELETLPYNEKEIANEKEYVLKKLGLSENDFDNLMKQKPKNHTDFKTEKTMWNRYFKLISILKFKK